MITSYHTKYYAHELTRKCSSHQVEKLSQSIFNATVDLNPHQIDAALFAFRSPLSRGALLADEVGLGKTIEAGLIISQLWSENKRKILCILPAALRPQWYQELIEKFFVDSIILEAKNYNQLLDQGAQNPFEQVNKVVMCSYHFARAKAQAIAAIDWDLVVLDEAHRLRNVYKKSNKIARTIRDAIAARPKVLLTATPLQNSPMELYGLISFIDPHIFGSEESFREQFAVRAGEAGENDFRLIRARIGPICQRTLRRQVTEYIRYTNRVSITEDFTPTDDDLRVYEMVSEYLQRPQSFALPTSQRSLMTLVLRKILASSSFAISTTLGTMIRRLELKASKSEEDSTAIEDEVAKDFESMDEISEEWAEEEETDNLPGEKGGLTQEQEKAFQAKAIRKEVDELKSYKNLAESITLNAKGEALLVALKKGFDRAVGLGAPQKALIFTESRRTQQYLKSLLENRGYAGQVVTLSGTNNDDASRAIYSNWRNRNTGRDCVTGLASVDIRTALVDEFRDRAFIMIATESGAEGLNLQFCSLVVNYDLPWNPQRIEQRIGRCHRYGQQHDVVVINFLNRKNAADQRVFDILNEKLRLFSGIFGASDEILGALGSGIDFEKRIHEIYQSCRSTAEINAAFDQLQNELEEQIRAQLADTRAKLLENFDEDVNTRLRITRDTTDGQVDRFGEYLWRLTQHELGVCADFDPLEHAFQLKVVPNGLQNNVVPLGTYRLVTQKNTATAHHYRLGHPLAEHIVQIAKTRDLACREVIFRYDQHDKKVSLVEALQGKAGWLRLSLFQIAALEQEEYLLFTGLTDDGKAIDTETCAKLFYVPGELQGDAKAPSNIGPSLDGVLKNEIGAIIGQIAQRNQSYFEAEMEKLDGWAEDLKDGLERELKELVKEIKVAKKEARQVTDLDAKVAHHKRAKEMERTRNEKRKNLFAAQDQVDARKEALITEIEGRLKQTTDVSHLFTIRWRVI